MGQLCAFPSCISARISCTQLWCEHSCNRALLNGKCVCFPIVVGELCAFPSCEHPVPTFLGGDYVAFLLWSVSALCAKWASMLGHRATNAYLAMLDCEPKVIMCAFQLTTSCQVSWNGPIFEGCAPSQTVWTCAFHTWLATSAALTRCPCPDSHWQQLTVVHSNWQLLTALSSTVNYCLLLSMSVNGRQWLSMTVNDCQWLSMSGNVCQSLSMTVNDCPLLLITVNYCQWLSMTVSYCQLVSITVNDCQLRTVNYCHLLSMTVNYCQWLSMTVHYC